MTAKGRKQRREPWRTVLDEFIEDPGKSNGKPKVVAASDSIDDALESLRAKDTHVGGLDKVVDYDDRGKKSEVEQAPLVPGDDGDDNPAYAQPKPKFDKGKLDNGDISDPISVKLNPADNLPGQMAAAGHGFIVDDPRSRPWKTAPRTHCFHCGGPMPAPNVSDDKYRCEFDPDASWGELALIGADQGPDPWKVFRLGPGCRHLDGGCRCFRKGCQCSGCILRDLVLNNHERSVGQPRKYCTAECRKAGDNARNAWKRAVRAAEKRGVEPPPEPEDKGLKFLPVRGLRSNSEGGGSRYTSAVGKPWRVPRA